jgi:hypothetical protein
MNIKRLKKAYREAVDKRLMHNYRQLWSDLAALPRRQRWRLAWMLVRGDGNLDNALPDRR